MKISIFTPSNKTTYLKEAYESLKKQDHQDWEWVILLNGNALKENNFLGDGDGDERIKIVRYEQTTNKIGELKHQACLNCTGDAFLELDHDDILMPTALYEVNKAFEENENICFVYSNTVNWDTRTNTSLTYSNFYGWSKRPFKFRGHDLFENVSSKPSPHNLSKIWFAPNHLRCWKAKDYWKIGGHNQEMRIADDHELICRTYLHGELHHIDKPLYIYRIYGDNTWLQNAKDIQIEMWKNHNKYIIPMMEKWTDERKLDKIDLGARLNPAEGYKTVDLHDADIDCDLNGKWDLEDNSVGILRAYDVFEHLKDPIHTMNEVYRVLAHGGILDLQVPSTSSKAAFRDPTHVSFWNDESIWYYTKEQYAKYIQPQYKGRFQSLKTVEDKCGEIIWVRAHLIAIKNEEREFYGALEI